MDVQIDPPVRPLEAPFRPALLADWDDAAFVHYAVGPGLLQRHVPFELDLFEGNAYVSLVAFTQRGLRPPVGGRMAAALSAPLASHPFLNVRTYVRCGKVPGIHFLCEWIPNRLAAWLGPPLYGLPYRLGKLSYRYDRLTGACRHEIVAGGARLAFDLFVTDDSSPSVAQPGTLDEFLLERYVAFTRRGGKDCCFRVDHAPWSQRRVGVYMSETTLLEGLGLPLNGICPVVGHYSKGVKNVGLGPPVRVIRDRRDLLAAPCPRRTSRESSRRGEGSCVRGRTEPRHEGAARPRANGPSGQ